MLARFDPEFVPEFIGIRIYVRHLVCYLLLLIFSLPGRCLVHT